MSRNLGVRVTFLAYRLFKLGFVIWDAQVKPNPDNGFFVKVRDVEKRLELFDD